MTKPDVTLRPLTDRTALAPQWQQLEAIADASFFTSWGWIGTWLAHLPRNVVPHLLTVRRDGVTAALGLFSARRQFRYGLMPVRQWHLHETGVPLLDELTIEYNGLLVRRGDEEFATNACLDYFLQTRHDWDELHLPGVAPATGLEAQATQARGVLQNAPRPCHFVDLDALRDGKQDYIGVLSANSRYQLRAALRAYEQSGPIALTAAQTPAEARAFLDAMADLHQIYWTAKGEAGAFASPYFVAFHRDLVARRFAAGEIQLLKCAAGHEVIGYLYNFVKDGVVHNYQSGLRYDDTNKKKKPGFVAHYLAVLHNLERGLKVYDFMAGDRQYKASLGTHRRELWWAVMRRDRLRFRLEDALKRWKRVRTARPISQRAPAR